MPLPVQEAPGLDRRTADTHGSRAGAAASAKDTRASVVSNFAAMQRPAGVLRQQASEGSRERPSARSVGLGRPRARRERGNLKETYASEGGELSRMFTS